MTHQGNQMQPGYRPHILLAEDNDFNRQLASAALEKHGYRVTVAEDGERAVALFREQPFDLILMDVCMPRMDGYETTRAIRLIEQERGVRTRIIALTAHADAEARQACLDSGMDEMLVKPVSGKYLEESIIRSGQKGRGDDLSVEPVLTEMAVNGDTTGRPMAPAPFQAALSDSILADFGSTPERLNTYFSLLCHDLETQLEAMNAACETGDCAVLRDAAHAAKGVARGLRDQSLSRLAEEIESLAQLGELSGIKERVSDFIALYMAVKS
jgi:CheY-like chemotaxis protein